MMQGQGVTVLGRSGYLGMQGSSRWRSHGGHVLRAVVKRHSGSSVPSRCWIASAGSSQYCRAFSG